MKPFFIFVYLLYFSIPFLGAQVSIDSINFPRLKDQYLAQEIDPQGFSIGFGGAGQFWDYSNITLTGNEYGVRYIPLDSALASPFFPQANMVKRKGDFYEFYDVGLSEVQTYGTYNLPSDDLYKLSNPSLFLPPTLSYQDEFNDPFRGEADFGGVFFDVTGSMNLRADAIGSMQTPYGLHFEVIRIRYEEIRNYYIKGDTINGIQVRNLTYHWYDPYWRHPILEAEYKGFDAQTQTYSVLSGWLNSPGITGIEELSAASLHSLKIWPNPSQGRLELSFSVGKPNDLNFSLTDLNGKVIWSLENQKSAAGNNHFQLEIPLEIANGLYFLGVESEEKTNWLKLQINRP